ncbi:MAG: YbaB/EbfC family nucleoid-associated protein [Candidatus Aminicenantes bacterium]|nr:YbaB/EbfC family nucleoid-associated protein [Candidatus Aminicenantes bacterium]
MKNIGNLQKMMKTAKEMQEKLQKEMAEMRVDGNSGGGMVTVTVDGMKNIIALKIDPEVVNKDDVEMLQDLIIAAFNDATSKVDEQMSEKMGGLGAALKIPGLF